jgi:hypothetical protein
MLRIDTDPVAVRGGAVAEHDASDAIARWRCEVSRIAALVVDDRRHVSLPKCNGSVKATILTNESAHVTRRRTARPGAA